MTSPKSLSWVALLALAAAAFGIELWLFHDVWRHYYPANDDIALIVHSTDLGTEPLAQRIRSWFSEGFANYWHVYPEWSEPHTNYLRPGVNLAFQVLYLLIGTWWAGYLIACYALYALVLALLIDLAYRTYALRGWPLAIVAIGLATTPSAWSNGELFFNPTFAFDAVVTAMIVLAFRAYLARNYLGLTLLLALAVFTKETALAAAAAAFTGVLLHELPLLDPRRARLFIGRDTGVAALAESGQRGFARGLAIAMMIGLPVVIWLYVRWLAFGQEVGVSITTSHVESPVLHYLRQIVEWPFNAGAINAESVSALRRRDLGAVSVGLYAQVAINLLFSAIVLVMLGLRWRAIQRIPASEPPIAPDPARLFDTCLWLFWLGLMLVLNAVTPRIGLAAPVFAACLLGAQAQFGTVRRLRQLALGLLVAVAVTNVVIATQLVGNGVIETNVERSRNQTALVDLLRQNAMEGRKLLIVNDFSSRFVSNGDLRAFADIPGSLMRLSSIEYTADALFNQRPPPGFAREPVRIARDGDRLAVDVVLPDYLRFKFEDVRPGKLLELRDGDQLSTMSCVYRFPELKTPASRAIEFGRVLSLHCTIDGDVRVIYFDPAQHRYRVQTFAALQR